jgi:hypothetical protein
VSLVGLIDVEVDSLWLGDAVCNWLDKEYIPLDIHRTIGMLTVRYDVCCLLVTLTTVSA